MITAQQNYKFTNSINKYLNYWSQRPTVFVLSGSFIVLIVTLTLIGGVLFWMSGFGFVLRNNPMSQNESQVATSGLQTIKRMVGNQQVWSESIQKEYAGLFPNQIIKIQPIVYSYNDNFIGPNH